MSEWTPQYVQTPEGRFVRHTPDGPLQPDLRPGSVNYVEHPAQIPAMAAQSALDVQVAGGHYKAKAIQPVEYISANNLNFLEGCIVKRVTRWRDKMPLSGNRFEDLEKIKHEVDLLIEMEKRYGGEA